MYSKSRRSALPSGTEAPDFILRSTPDQWLTLSEFRSQPLVLAFYPADWSPVCGDQMTLYNEMLKEFHDLGAELIGISVDGAWCHAAFARDRQSRWRGKRILRHSPLERVKRNRKSAKRFKAAETCSASR
jgi:alkyl hydroperoxide reductase subunit AhpC